MANTKIPVELSSTPGIVDNSNATALTINSDENAKFEGLVGINKDINASVALSVGADATSSTSYGLEVTNSTANTRFLVNGEGSSIFYKTDNAEGMRFDATSGTLTKPSQPYIRCSGSTAAAVTSHGSVTDFSYWTNQVQRGITRSGAVFTVPTAGAYLITYNLYFWIDNSGQGVSHSIYFSKGSTTVQEVQWESQDSSFFYSDNTKGSSLVLDMAAGDTFKFAVNADIYGGTTHCTMSAYLLG